MYHHISACFSNPIGTLATLTIKHYISSFITDRIFLKLNTDFVVVYLGGVELFCFLSNFITWSDLGLEQSCKKQILQVLQNLIFLPELTYTVYQEGYGEYINQASSLWDQKLMCARTDNVFFPISKVCNGMVSLNNKIAYCNSGVSLLADPGKARGCSTNIFVINK